MSRELNEEAIFDLARKIESTEARAEYVEQSCGDNTALLERVKALLEVHDKQAGFLESPPSAFDATVSLRQTEQPGMVIGKYKLMEQIGEGGMGVVYVADQEKPIRRRVALKVIKPGMDSKEVISRFDAERQALALMDHPNIAKVHDAGTTESGRPYFVMELVRGVPVTEYCDLNKFSARQRLELFVHVCQAVQHAHQKGVIHRDLKPSNVLVTEHDGSPVIKVIDFGVAKAINQQLTERTIYTRHQQMVGTPMYMSPEQAELSGLDVDTRSDIYSLGVLLYELLTGTTPFDKERLSEAAYDEIRRIIREDEPSKPSTKVRTLGKTAETVSGYRSTYPARLSQLLRGDLDWIVMKSLEKDRNRRYDTAKGLANDIERHLSDEPVVARPPSATYQFQKFARRHKAFLTSAAVISLALIVGTGAASWMAVVADVARSKAESNMKRALDAETRQRDLADEARVLAEKELVARQAAERFAASEAAARKEARRLLYGADMNVSLQAWREGNVDRVLELLRRHQPQDGQDDLRGFEWYHLWHLCSRALQAKALKHDSKVLAIAFSPTQNRLAAVGSKWLTIWNLDNLQKEQVIESDEMWVFDVAFSPDGKTIATANYDKTAKVWEVQSGEKLLELPHEESVWSVEFAPSGELLATGSGDGDATLWDVATGEEVQSLANSTGSNWRSTTVAFSTDGQLLAMGTREKGVAVFDVQLLEERDRFVVGDVQAIDFSPGGETIALKLFTNELVLWDLASNEEKHRVAIDPTSDTGGGGEAVFSSHRDILAVDGPANTIEIYDGLTGATVDTIAGHSGPVETIAFSPSGRIIASGSSDGTVRLWDLRTNTSPSMVAAHLWLTTSIGFSPDGRLLASAGSRQLKLWDTNTWRLEKTIEEPASQYGIDRYGATFSPDGKLLAYVVHPPGQRKTKVVRLWNIHADELRDLTSVVDERLHSMAFSPDSRHLAIAGNEDIKIWSVAAQEKPKTLRGHSGVVEKVVFSPDGSCLASGSFDFTVKLWDVQGGTLRHSLEGHAEVVPALAFTANGELLISGSRDRTIRLWDVKTGREAHLLSSNIGSVTGFALSTDSETLAVAADRTVTLWDLSERRERARYPCDSLAYSIAFSPDGRTLVAGLSEGPIRIWHAATPEEVRRAGW